MSDIQAFLFKKKGLLSMTTMISRGWICEVCILHEYIYICSHIYVIELVLFCFFQINKDRQQRIGEIVRETNTHNDLNHSYTVQ